MQTNEKEVIWSILVCHATDLGVYSVGIGVLLGEYLHFRKISLATKWRIDWRT